ncbi:BON domain-containing protein [Pandoraea pnomenusa]|uniref:BON domain-containing protein n=1 Tax=Pandoraea pnomenusa TaxID=93220 RepID=UPI00333FB311
MPIRLKRPSARIAIASLYLCTLSGCVPIVLGAATATGMAATDRRSLGAQMDDTSIELRVGSRVGEVAAPTAHVNVSSYNRRVLLTGEVPADSDLQAIAAATKQDASVRAVFNEAVLAPEASSFGDRSSDTLIATKVKASLVAEKGLPSSAFKVVVERKVVYLMGMATKDEADLASSVASRVPDVASVVRVLEIVPKEAIERIAPAKASDASLAQEDATYAR